MANVRGAIKFLNGAVQQADEVMGSAVSKSSNQLIKAGGNFIESNKSAVQRTATNLSTTVRRGADAANDVVNSRTVTKAMNNNVPEVSGVPAVSKRKTRRLTGEVSDVPSAQDTSVRIIGEGNSRGGGFDTSNAIDLDPIAIDLEPIEVGPNQRVERRSERRGNRTQQPDTPRVIYADGPTAGGGGNGSGGNGGNTSSSSASGGNSSGGNNRRQTGGNQEQRKVRSASGKLSGFGKQAQDFFLGGTMDSYNNYKSGMGIMESIAKAHQNEDGSVNMLKAAGTFMTASAAARVASGGGAYKDRYGNPNLIGVPFI